MRFAAVTVAGSIFCVVQWLCDVLVVGVSMHRRLFRLWWLLLVVGVAVGLGQRGAEPVVGTVLVAAAVDGDAGGWRLGLGFGVVCGLLGVGLWPFCWFLTSIGLLGVFFLLVWAQPIGPKSVPPCG